MKSNPNDESTISKVSTMRPTKDHNSSKNELNRMLGCQNYQSTTIIGNLNNEFNKLSRVSNFSFSSSLFFFFCTVHEITIHSKVFFADSLFKLHYSPIIVHDALFTDYCSRCTIHRSLFTIYYSRSTVHGTIHFFFLRTLIKDTESTTAESKNRDLELK